jgi:hypothetical protein
MPRLVTQKVSGGLESGKRSPPSLSLAPTLKSRRSFSRLIEMMGEYGGSPRLGAKRSSASGFGPWVLIVMASAGFATSCGGDGGVILSGTGGDGGSNQRGTGGAPIPSFSRPVDYIRNEGFPKLVVEVDEVSSLSPRSGVVDSVRSRLDEVLDKPGGIVFSTDETDLESADTFGNGDGVWTFEELRQLAGERANLSLNEGEIDIHTMWVDGTYEESNALGVAWGQRFVAIFAERITGACGLAGLSELLCPLAEATIWTHEIGHVIGLVDNGIPMVHDHRDPDHGPHDVSNESVMYWAYDGVGVMDILRGRLLGNEADVIPWGTECLNDLAAIRDNWIEPAHGGRGR